MGDEIEEKREYWCEYCGRLLPINDGIILHDDVEHDDNAIFDNEHVKKH